MKPSERRALEAEKRAAKEALEREKALEKKANDAQRYDGSGGGAESKSESEGERLNTDAEYRKIPKGDIEVKGDGYHREGFFGSHVRLITFIITLTLVLTVLGPWGIDMLVSRSRETWAGGNIEEGILMDADRVIALSEMGYTMTWKNLEGYSYEDSSYTKKGKTTYNHKYNFEESEMLCLEVISSQDTGSPDIVRLIDYESGEYIDIREESAREFLERLGYIE